MIGVIGYGWVGKAVVKGFSKSPILISDPAYNDLSIQYMCDKNPEAIFVCVPTPTDNSNYAILRGVLKEIKDAKYTGLVVVKSTVLPQYISEFDVQYNPEFLSRPTAEQDFVRPFMVVIGGERAKEVWALYEKYSTVQTNNVVFTDLKTATLVKYTFNTFYATKVTFMNQMYDVAQQLGVNFDDYTKIVAMNPNIGSNHLQVPGYEGRGYAGPCLPKDTEALAREYNLELLYTVQSLNSKYRAADKE